jgi:hypothetical protein
LHTAVPDATGSNQSSAGRVALTWDAAANGDLTLTAGDSFTGGAANGPCVALGFWSTGTGGTFYGYFLLTGDQTFDASGVYNLQAITVTGSSAGA